MKSIFYTSTLFDDNLGLRDKFLYSQIIYMSLWGNGRETFGANGDNLSLDEFLDTDDGKKKKVPLSDRCPRYDYTELLQISRSQQYKSWEVLRRRGYIVGYGADEYVVVDAELISNFFELQVKTGLRGTPLIVYSYIYNKSKRYGWVDKYHVCIARDLNISPLVLANCLRDLSNASLIQKKRKGKQTLLRAN